MTAIAAPSPHEERWLLAQLDRRPWREVLTGRLGRISPGLYAHLTDSSQAAVLSLLETVPSDRCLDATGGWGQLAVPLARQAAVTVLAPSSVRGDIVRRIAAQEGVSLNVVIGALACSGLRAAAFDVALLHHPPALSGAADPGAAVETLRDVARVLRPGGRVYFGTANALSRPALESPAATGRDGMFTLAEFSALFARVGVTPIAAYACFPHHETPRFYVPLALTNRFAADGLAVSFAAARPTPADAALAREGIAQHFAPSYVFLLELDAESPTSDAAPE